MGAWAAQVLYPIAFDFAWAAVSRPGMGALTAVGWYECSVLLGA